MSAAAGEQARTCLHCPRPVPRGRYNDCGTPECRREQVRRMAQEVMRFGQSIDPLPRVDGPRSAKQAKRNVHDWLTKYDKKN